MPLPRYNSASALRPSSSSSSSATTAAPFAPSFCTDVDTSNNNNESPPPPQQAPVKHRFSLRQQDELHQQLDGVHLSMLLDSDAEVRLEQLGNQLKNNADNWLAESPTSAALRSKLEKSKSAGLLVHILANHRKAPEELTLQPEGSLTESSSSSSSSSSSDPRNPCNLDLLENVREIAGCILKNMYREMTHECLANERDEKRALHEIDRQFGAANELLKINLLEKRSPLQKSSKQPSSIAERRIGQLPPEAVKVFQDWLVDHFSNPYPTEREKLIMSEATGVEVKQINTWFSNARARLWRPAMQQAVTRDDI